MGQIITLHHPCCGATSAMELTDADAARWPFGPDIRWGMCTACFQAACARRYGPSAIVAQYGYRQQSEQFRLL